MSDPNLQPDLKEQVVIVTGGNIGIGYETVKQLARRGATVYMASRTDSKAHDAIKNIAREHPETDGNVHFMRLDLADLKQVAQAAGEFLEKEKKLDILINNAGIMATPFGLTTDGVEIQFQTNHLGHFLLTEKLLPLLERTGRENGRPTRIVNVSSRAHRMASFVHLSFDSLESVNRPLGPWIFGRYMRYGQSKVANILHSREINRRFTHVKSIPLHPGVVATNLYSHFPYSWITKTPFFITPAQGAICTLYAATSPEVDSKSLWGKYLIPPGRIASTTRYASSDTLASDLWNLSQRILKEKGLI